MVLGGGGGKEISIDLSDNSRGIMGVGEEEDFRLKLYPLRYGQKDYIIDAMRLEDIHIMASSTMTS